MVVPFTPTQSKFWGLGFSWVTSSTTPTATVGRVPRTHPRTIRNGSFRKPNRAKPPHLIWTVMANVQQMWTIQAPTRRCQIGTGHHQRDLLHGSVGVLLVRLDLDTPIGSTFPIPQTVWTDALPRAHHTRRCGVCGILPPANSAAEARNARRSARRALAPIRSARAGTAATQISCSIQHSTTVCNQPALPAALPPPPPPLPPPPQQSLPPHAH
jgi:hypothetical protein